MINDKLDWDAVDPKSKKKKERETPAGGNTGLGDLEVFAVGRTADGKYFISVGQGGKNLWYSRTFEANPALKPEEDPNIQLYNTLYNWFIENKQGANKAGKNIKHSIYHFNGV